MTDMGHEIIPGAGHTLREIYSQDAACERALAEAPARLAALRGAAAGRLGEVVMTGCGSSFHLAQSAAWYWQEALRRPVSALPASELLQRPQHYVRPAGRPLVFAISRTGGTTEILLAVDRLRRLCDATAIAVAGQAGTQVARACDAALELVEGAEHSVVMTRAYTSMLYAMCLLADGLGDGRDAAALAGMPDRIGASLARTEGAVAPLAGDRRFGRFVFLGSGPLWPTASEAALKMTEMALETAVAYRTLEFRHGPKALLDEGTLVTVFPTKRDGPFLATLLDDILSAGATALVAGESPVAHDRVRTADGAWDLPDRLRPVALAHLGQQMAYWRAAARGLDPDAPRHLARTVTFDPPAPGAGAPGGPSDYTCAPGAD